MKVVDEKGRLFGKLNMIDLLVILVILAAVVVVGMKFLGGNDSAGDGTVGVEASRLTYVVRVTAQTEEMAEQAASYVDEAAGKRDQLMANGEMVDAYIVDCWTEPTRYNRLSNGDVDILDQEQAAQAGLVDICFEIEATVRPEQKNGAAPVMTSLVGTQEVRTGKGHIVKTIHLEFPYGTVESCVWEPVG